MSAPEPSCRYCGASLDARFYFCTTCATPYCDEDQVLSRIPRFRPTDGMQIREKAPQAANLFWTYFGVVLGGSLVAHFAIGDAHPAALLVFLDSLLLVTTLVFTVRYWPSLVPQLKRLGFDRWEAWVGLAALVPLLGVNRAWHEAMRDLLGAEGPSFIGALREAGVAEGVLVLSIAIFPAITEEIAFRGLLQHWLHVAVRPATAIALAGALFAALHFSLLSFPYLFACGLLFGWMRWRTGSLWPSIVAHFLHNFAVLAWVDG